MDIVVGIVMLAVALLFVGIALHAAWRKATLFARRSARLCTARLATDVRRHCRVTYASQLIVGESDYEGFPYRDSACRRHVARSGCADGGSRPMSHRDIDR